MITQTHATSGAFAREEAHTVDPRAERYDVDRVPAFDHRRVCFQPPPRSRRPHPRASCSAMPPWSARRNSARTSGEEGGDFSLSTPGGVAQLLHFHSRRRFFRRRRGVLGVGLLDGCGPPWLSRLSEVSHIPQFELSTWGNSGARLVVEWACRSAVTSWVVYLMISGCAGTFQFPRARGWLTVAVDLLPLVCRARDGECPSGMFPW